LIAIATQPRVQSLPEEVDRLFREHSKFIYRTAFRVTGNGEDAEDVLQSLFVQIVKRELPRDFNRNPKAYLYRAAVNMALNVVRSRARMLPVPALDEVKDPSCREKSRGESEMDERLRQALGELGAKAAEILVLRHVHGYSDAEIAKFLGTSRGTVAVSLFRSRARLRKSIRSYLGDKS
jgi:RNA polymerase sigma-70 factor (ECF subfamily)